MFSESLEGRKKTYTCKLDTAVTALGGSALLLDVKVTELATRGLDNSDLVGTSVVAGKKLMLARVFPGGI